MKKSKYLLSFLALLVGAGLFLVCSQNVKALEIDLMIKRLNNANIPGEDNNQGTGENENNDKTGDHTIEPDILIPDDKKSENPKKPEEENKEDKEKEKPTPKKEEKPKSNLPNTGIENHFLTYLFLSILGATFFIIFKAFYLKKFNN